MQTVHSGLILQSHKFPKVGVPFRQITKGIDGEHLKRFLLPWPVINWDIGVCVVFSMTIIKMVPTNRDDICNISCHKTV